MILKDYLSNWEYFLTRFEQQHLYCTESILLMRSFVEDLDDINHIFPHKMWLWGQDEECEDNGISTSWIIKGTIVDLTVSINNIRISLFTRQKEIISISITDPNCFEKIKHQMKVSLNVLKDFNISKSEIDAKSKKSH